MNNQGLLALAQLIGTPDKTAHPTKLGASFFRATAMRLSAAASYHRRLHQWFPLDDSCYALPILCGETGVYAWCAVRHALVWIQSPGTLR